MVISGGGFMPGVELSGVLYEEAVRPVLQEGWPGVAYAAARVGAGSEVLGFDTARSADHDWGPRLEIFLEAEDRVRYGAEMGRVLGERLPKQVRGWPTHFQESGDPLDPVGRMRLTDGPVNHRVDVYDVDGWLAGMTGVAGLAEIGSAEGTLPARVWLAIAQQRLAEVTGGAVFHDGLGSLSAVRRRLAWYPEQVWRYLLACQWQRISQEEAFVGRCAEVGDDIGSAVVAGRLVRDLMRLCLLLERRYAPYSKWLGSAFRQLEVAESLAPSLRGVLAATDYPARERHLCDGYETVAALQNACGLIAPVDPRRRPYHARPFLVLHAERFAHALAQSVTDPELRDLPLVGGVDQWADSTDLLNQPQVIRAATGAIGRAEPSARLPEELADVGDE
ncbi:DUF4037 domain-containing protein [Streptomyces sp. TRM68367]|uniref:DUF4037 domain-containing protein n=1 Tax=Streptomyces sp. TRM68367 TaxID=2758415 RepID=UPI00165AA265|nr:DUF4037 domain-containing protein [Streptomyces sp. TRM68367]MBC9729980.1 DUF4037 domain-containing protein [Streptomyces sp. TRM68367]